MTNLLMHSLLLSVASSIMPGGNSSYDKAIDTTLEILIPCMVKSSNNKILLAGEYSDFLTSRRHFFGVTPIALVGESKNSMFDLLALTHQSFIIYKKTFHEFVRFLYKLRFFVVITSSQPILKLTLKRIKDTTWANSNGCFIMIDKRTDKRGCVNAYSYLWTAWQFDLLRSIFICVDPKEGVLIYSYDPYTAQVSWDWTEAGRFSGRNGHPWLLLKKKFDKESTSCQFKRIKKTSALHGYEVKLCGIYAPPHLSINDNITGIDRFGGDNGMIIKTILQKLNATINITIKPMLFGGIDKYGRMTGLLGEVASGLYDMAMNSRSFTMMWHLSYTYPYDESGICAMSQSSEEISELRKLMTLLTTPFMIISMILCVITLLIITKFDGFFEACLNIERLVVCVAMLRLPNINSYRIYICMIFLLSLTANAVFQSHWYSLLTMPQFYANIDTYDDLKDSGNDIYGTISFRDMIGEELDSRYHETSYDDCRNIVINSSNVVCVSYCYDILQRTLNEKSLHASKYKIREFVSTFIARENWPIFETFSRNLQKLVESGLVSLWKNQATEHLHREEQLRILSMTEFKVLKFRHLDFSFYILIIGNSCALLVFAMELIIHRHRVKIKRIIKKKLNRVNRSK
ncbi:uncharacterized protein LOC122517934 [Polistes fuscatus]|uniref:uncharacterized protein LOC122517934 n=1 Tax=Polistes fuscatus TaxID=30207 RepID=UPI001CA96066|nr:uncharacterized protein LOC122517934 [Polistes fuscatus]XP_043492497.1 uncharacterized protein LOC122517934 [Polistes fuscatus]XP_043492498.1 uncharacterized protein LOC122517934 [Polistes fuscatus]